MKDGSIYFPSELYDAVGIRPFAAPPDMTVPAAATRSTPSGEAAPTLTADMTTDEPIIGPVTTRHRIRIGKQAVAYTATFAELALTDADGATQATISSTGLRTRRCS